MENNFITNIGIFFKFPYKRQAVFFHSIINAILMIINISLYDKNYNHSCNYSPDMKIPEIYSWLSLKISRLSEYV